MALLGVAMALFGFGRRDRGPVAAGAVRATFAGGELVERPAETAAA
jgi:hypothetical protein